ncbi:hypothetical protein O1L44_11715 [Streptomyces noursei]|nr:hypothetical protein [Streptomyces noursei]
MNRYEVARAHAQWFARHADLYREQTTAAIREGRTIGDAAYEAARSVVPPSANGSRPTARTPASTCGSPRGHRPRAGRPDHHRYLDHVPAVEQRRAAVAEPARRPGRQRASVGAPVGGPVRRGRVAAVLGEGVERVLNGAAGATGASTGAR